MTSPTISILAGIAALVVHITASTLLVRRLRSRPPVVLHVVSAGAALVLLVAVLAWLADAFGMPLSLWTAAAILYSGAVGWLYAFSAVYKSISLGVLTTLARQPTGRLPFSTIAYEMVLPRFVERVDLLTAAGMVCRTAQGYEPTARGRTTAARFLRLRALFGVRNDGLYTDAQVPVRFESGQ